MTQEQSPFTIKAIDHPDPTISGVTHPVAPETLACSLDAPVAISSTDHALIKSLKKLHGPVVNAAMPLAQNPLNRRGTGRYNVGDVQSEADTNGAQLRSTVNKPRQQTRKLEPMDQEIIGPLDPNRKIMIFQPFCHRQCRPDTQQSGRR